MTSPPPPPPSERTRVTDTTFLHKLNRTRRRRRRGRTLDTDDGRARRGGEEEEDVSLTNPDLSVVLRGALWATADMAGCSHSYLSGPSSSGIPATFSSFSPTPFLTLSTRTVVTRLTTARRRLPDPVINHGFLSELITVKISLFVGLRVAGGSGQ